MLLIHIFMDLCRTRFALPLFLGGAGRANFRPMSFLITAPQKRDALDSFESLCRYPYGPSLSYRPISPTPLPENARQNPPSHRAQQERKTPG